MSQIARTSDSANPLDQLPQALVRPAGEFYAFFSDSLKGVTGIAFRLSWWMRSREDGGEGLTVDDAIAAMRSLMKPERAGLSQYAGQVMAALAVEVEEVLRVSRAKAKQRKDREDAERDKASATGIGEVRKLLSGIGQL